MNKDSRMTIEDLAAIIDTRITGQDRKVEDLAALMEKRFIQQDEKFDAKLDIFAAMILRSFEAQSAQIQEVINELRDFKSETDHKFVTHREFDRFKLRLKH